MEFQRFFQIIQRFLLGLTLTGDVNFQTLRDIPVTFAPDCRGERSLHDAISSHSTVGVRRDASQSFEDSPF